MRIQKLLTKYSIILLFYIVLARFVQPYGMQLYFSYNSTPDLLGESAFAFDTIFKVVTFLINLIFMAFIWVDSKHKKALDWLIVVITFFSVETGICIFLIWQVYRELNRK